VIGATSVVYPAYPTSPVVTARPAPIAIHFTMSDVAIAALGASEPIDPSAVAAPAPTATTPMPSAASVRARAASSG